MIGRYLEARAKKRTSDSIRELIGLQPTVATAIEVDENGEIVSQKEVSIADIVVDDLLLVKPGEKIPVDGDVVGGESYVDESMINGEPIPKVKKDGEEVFAGTINQDGVLQIKAKKIGKETVLSNIIRLVEKAQSSRPPVQKFANTIVSYFIPVILTIAIIVFLIWYVVLGASLLFSLTCLISILVVACPCALGLATPIALISGIGRGAKSGILIKNGSALENAANEIREQGGRAIAVSADVRKYSDAANAAETAICNCSSGSIYTALTISLSNLLKKVEYAEKFDPFKISINLNSLPYKPKTTGYASL